jgi:hypothetical protein
MCIEHADFEGVERFVFLALPVTFPCSHDPEGSGTSARRTRTDALSY